MRKCPSNEYTIMDENVAEEGKITQYNTLRGFN